MSNYYGNDEACPHCGLTYRRFRTGFSYRDVYVMLMDYSEDSADWKYKGRHTILGKMHQIKKEMWFAHVELGACLQDPRNIEVACEDSSSIAAS